MTVDPTSEPRDGSPTIHVNIRTIRNKDDREKEMERMWREHEAETRRALKLAEEQGKSTKDGDLVGEEVYDFSPVTSWGPESNILAIQTTLNNKTSIKSQKVFTESSCYFWAK